MIIDHYTLYQWLNFPKKVNVVRNWILLAKLHPTFKHKKDCRSNRFHMTLDAADLKAVIKTTGCAANIQGNLIHSSQPTTRSLELQVMCNDITF